VPTVVAAFSSPDRAKAAVAALERRGVAPADLRVLGAGTTPDLAAADERTVGWLTGVAVRGAVIGALVGGLVLLAVIAIATSADPEPVWIAASFGGALAGAVVGALLVLGRRAPRHPDAWSVHGQATDEETRLSVTARGVSAAELSALLQAAGATSVTPG
jgi:hypothetical protein